MTVLLQRLRAYHARLKPGSDKNFGYVFAAFFFIVSMWPVIWGLPPRYWTLVAATAFALAALAFPRVLRPINLTWFYAGLLLNEITNPVIMALIFTTVIVPIGLLMRLMGKDLLDLRRRPEAKTYWTIKNNRSMTPQSMRDQF
ncbi:MAG: SxtJ family membrane protein [Methylocella sp.]